MGIEGKFLNIIKVIYGKPTANIILNSEKLKAFQFPPNIGNKTRMPTYPTPIQHSTGGPSHGNQTTQRNKRHPDWQGRCQTVPVWR